jgi:hypothetical protein
MLRMTIRSIVEAARGRGNKCFLSLWVNAEMDGWLQWWKE